MVTRSIQVTRYGQAIGAVVADTKAHAKAAAALVQVSYEDILPCIVTIEVMTGKAFLQK